MFFVACAIILAAGVAIAFLPNWVWIGALLLASGAAMQRDRDRRRR